MEWETIPGFAHYKINQNGEVFSLYSDRIIKNWQHQTGYIIVDLTENGKRYHKRVHRLVLLAFVGKPPKGQNDVNHKDGDKTNNSLVNLEYCSRGENIAHRHRELGYKSSRGKRKHTLTTSEIHAIRAMHSSKKYTLKEIRNHWNISQGCLCNVLYRCGNYKDK